MDTAARVGIMGGSFDPIHLGHIQIARLAREQLALDKVLFLPAGDPPHKQRLAGKEHRMEMVRLAIQGETGFEVSSMEVDRPGVTYTVDTLSELRRRRPGDTLIYIVGVDTLFYLETWKNVERALSLCELAVVNRRGFCGGDIREKAGQVEAQYHTKVHLLSGSGPEISSTQIRTMGLDAEGLKRCVPQAVARYILKHHLYGGNSN
jgi:nicotinate-nucleotide adenylyltransferase